MDESIRNWHKEQVKLYKREKPIYDIYASGLERALRDACSLHAPLSIVQARPKAISSFAEKAIRKAHKYRDPFRQLTDLCGARVITITLPQMEAMCRFVEEGFRVDWANTVDVGERMGVMEFGYRSMHYVVQLTDNGVVPTDVVKRVGDRKAEIQVRTVLMHAWSEISHDRLYKNSIKVPGVLQRQAARLSAVIEEAERSFAQLVDRLDGFIEGHSAYMDRDRLAGELDLLTTVLANESDPGVRRSLSLRAAALARIACDWRGVESLLKQYEKTDSVESLQLLGEAACHLNSSKPSGPGYARGVRLLDKASALAPDRADIHVLRAEAALRQPNRLGEAREHYQRAFQIDPSNPYSLMSFLECEVQLRGEAKPVGPLAAAIRGGIERCREHIEVSIEIPRAHFTLGKFHLLLGERDSAIHAYLRAIDVCLDPLSGASPHLLSREIESLDWLKAASTSVAPGEWWSPMLIPHMRALLAIALFLKTGDKSAMASVRKHACSKFKGGLPVLLLAGGCGDAYACPPAASLPVLLGMLAPFEGTVIGGGTSQGVPGLLGAAVAQLGRKGRRRFTAIGYHPRTMSPKTRPDQRYDSLIETQANDFSIFESIQSWIDLVAGGVAPADIKLLAINGGPITALEIRLALALGAKVCAPAETGGAALAIHEDKAWSGHGHLCDLPMDAMTLRAFLLDGSTALERKQLDAIGRRIHENYLRETASKVVDPSHQPWESLNEGLRQSNRDQAAFAARILRAAGFGVRRATSPLTPPRFTEADIEVMAEMEHGRWMYERITKGWRFGPVKDIAKKTSPYLVPWDKLEEQIKDYDRAAVRQFPEVLASAGFEVCREQDQRKIENRMTRS